MILAAQIVLLDVMAEQSDTNVHAEMTCYVCLEPCLERSDCRCQAVVHACCLRDEEQQLATSVCTICKHAIGEPEAEAAAAEPEPAEPEPEAAAACTSCIGAVYIFFLYCICGWIGKCVLFLVGVDVEYFLAFWTLLHLVCVLAVVVLTALVVNVVRILNYQT